MIYSATNLKTGVRIEGRSKDLMQIIGCRHNDPYAYARSNSIYKGTWRINVINKPVNPTEESAEEMEDITEMPGLKVDCFGYDKTKRKCKVLKILECKKKECKFYKSKKNVFNEIYKETFHDT